MWPRGTSVSNVTGCAVQPYSSSGIAATLAARAQLTGCTLTGDVVDQHRLGDRVVAVVAQREEHALGAARAGELTRASVQDQHRRAAALSPDLELAPVHAEAQPGAERLEPRLLRGEARGEVRHGILAAAAVRDLVVGEDAVQEALVPALEDL